jgi:glutamine synthetase
MIDTLGELKWGIHDVVAEGAYSQFELDFHYTHLLEMADRFVFLRVLIKEVAKKHGMFATFMPKPTTGDWRSGGHINFSLQAAGRPGENLFVDKNGTWSKVAFGAVGGILSHADALSPAPRSIPTTASSPASAASRAGPSPGRRPTSPTGSTTARRCCACRRTASASRTAPPTCA